MDPLRKGPNLAGNSENENSSSPVSNPAASSLSRQNSRADLSAALPTKRGVAAKVSTMTRARPLRSSVDERRIRRAPSILSSRE